MKKLILIILIVTIGLSTIVLLFSAKNKVPTNMQQVATSFYPLYFFTKEIAGDRADVLSITPASAEPHDYEPTASQIAKIEGSKMLVLNGGSLETWGNKIKDELKDKKVLIVTAGEELANKKVEEEGKLIQDPHIWLDPILAKKEVEKIEKGFEQIDEANSDYYRLNAEKFENELDKLDSDYKKGLANCQKKDFVTSHAAFGYLAARYGLNQIPINGVSPDQEPSSQKLAEITNLVRRQNIKVIFFESLLSPKLSETIAAETGAKALVLDPIEGISDKNDNYLIVMERNLANLQIALECKK